MRRIDMINAANNLQHAFKESKIDTYLLPSPNDKTEPEVIMNAYHKYLRAYDSFGETEKKILDIFGLSGLENPSLWAKIITGDKNVSRDIGRPFFRGITYLTEYLIRIVDLLKQDNLEYLKQNLQETIPTTEIQNKEIITVILPENSKEASSPERLIKVLESINLFYKTFALLFDNSNNDLSVVAIDSGSDKSFDFLGGAKIVNAIKELIIELWDRVVFYRERKLHERIDLISKSLPIIEKINSLEKNGTIGKEQSEILRRNIFEGAKNFINCGAILTEFSRYNNYDPRILMAPEPKLLTMPESNTSTENYSPDPKTSSKSLGLTKDNFSDEERELIKKLLEKETKRNNRKKRES